MATWRAQPGPEQEGIFPRGCAPGMAALSDCTHLADLGVTLGGVLFPTSSSVCAPSMTWPR